MRPLPLLLTRPAKASAKLAGRLADAADRIVISPLLEIVPCGTLLPVGGGLLLTSANAVTAYVALGGGPGPEAWVVGPGTSARANEAGLAVRGVAPTAEALARIVPPDAGPLLHLRGEVQRGALAADLRARGIEARDAVIYRQTPVALTVQARQLLSEGPIVVPLYSPRTADLFGIECPRDALGHVRAVCLSDAVADAFPGRPVKIAARPDGETMERAVRMALSRNAC